MSLNIALERLWDPTGTMSLLTFTSVNLLGRHTILSRNCDNEAHRYSWCRRECLQEAVFKISALIKSLHAHPLIFSMGAHVIEVDRHAIDAIGRETSAVGVNPI